MSIFTSNIELSSDNYPTIRPTLDLNFAATKTLDHRITFTRDSAGTYVDELGIIRYATNNVPRFDHDPTTGESLGLLIEESRTNQVQYSNDGYGLGDAPYYGNWNSSSYTDNFAVAPDGTTTAWKMTPTSPSASKVKRINVTAGNTYTFSVWLKKDPSVSVSDGIWDYLKYLITWSQNGSTVTSATIEQLVSGSTTSAELTTEWRRFSVSYTAPANVTSMEFGLSNSNSGTGDPGYSVFVWGAQLEEGAFPTSYIPTNGTTVTRAQDTTIIKGTNFTDFYNQTEGTLFGEFTIKNETYSSAAIANINQEPGSSYANSIMFVEVGNAQGYFGRTYKSSSGINLSNSSSVLNSLHPSTTPQKVTFGYTTITGGELRAYWNGNNVTSSSDLSKVPTTLTNMRIGRGWDGSDVINAHIRKLSYYPKRLPDAQLQGLTQQ